MSPPTRLDNCLGWLVDPGAWSPLAGIVILQPGREGHDPPLQGTDEKNPTLRFSGNGGFLWGHPSGVSGVPGGNIRTPGDGCPYEGFLRIFPNF